MSWWPAAPLLCKVCSFKQKYTLVQEVYSSHRCVLAFFSTVALYSSGLHCVAKKSYERRTWHKYQFSFAPVSCTVVASTCVLTTLALVFMSPYSFLHPLTELLRLFKRMMKSFHDTLENQLSKSGSESSSQHFCMHFSENTKYKNSSGTSYLSWQRRSRDTCDSFREFNFIGYSWDR